MKKTNEPKTHTIPEVAKMLGVSRDTIYRLIRSGDLVKIKIGRSAKITAESFDTYWNRLQEGHPKAA